MNQSKEKVKRVKEVLETEKREGDLLKKIPPDGKIYFLILHGADEANAKVACKRLKQKIESEIEGVNLMNIRSRSKFTRKG